ncbi:MAG: sugar transferase [Clostridia bacterium]|nr:sugar transferase [Clostridia bacterium]
MNNRLTVESEPHDTTANGTVKKQYTVSPEVPAGGAVYRFFKRSFDALFSALALLVFLLPMLVIALCVKCDSRGPVFFTQDRLGKDGRPFCVYKFRTMVVGAEEFGPQWASRNDDRCTRVGRFLRKSRLDELPQFLNILRGEMSLVGPRPERAYFYDKFETYIHGFKNRLAVTPGLTGLAQVNGGYELEPEEKIVYDMQYIREQSFWLDLKLMFRTVKLIFTHEGAR